MVGWGLLADLVPIYPLYALMFADTGLSAAEISGLFLIWSGVGITAEVPFGALADRFSRRSSMVAGAGLQALAYVVWTATPGFPGFAAGFVLWGLGGALVSGSQEALLYDGLAAAGAEEHYARINGWVTSAGFLAQLPAAAVATVLFEAGGYQLVGWISVAGCAATALLTSRLPEPPRQDSDDSYFATLEDGLSEVTARPVVRDAALAAALFGGLDAFEEYFPLVARDWAVPTQLIPGAMALTALAGAAGSALGGPAARLRTWALGLVLAVAGAALGVAALLRAPWGLAVIVVFYGLYRAVLVVVDSRLQERIEGSSRATVTSVASLGVEIAALLVYAAWALGESLAVAVLFVVMAGLVPRLLRARTGQRGPRS
jgi:predicted MFS family arabinose efflux permease